MADLRKALISACDATNTELKKEASRSKSKYSGYQEFRNEELTHVGPGAEQPPYYVPTGIWQFDQHYRGLPGGRYVEVFGNFSTGKTSLLSSVFGQAQQMGGAALLLDRESTFLLERAVLFGMDPALYVREKAKSIESAFIVVETWIANFYKALEGQYVELEEKTKKKKPTKAKKNTKKKKTTTKQAPRIKTSRKQEKIPLVVGWDTLAAIPSQFELDNPGVQRPGSMAKPIREAMRRQLYYMSQLGIITIFNNHETHNIGFAGKTTPGGGMPKYSASFRLKMSKVYKGEIKFGDKIVGETFRLKVSKAKIGPQLLEFDYPIFHDIGYSQEYEIFNLLRDLKSPMLSEGGGGWYSLVTPDGPLKFTRTIARETLRDNPDALKLAKMEGRRLMGLPMG